MDSRSAATVAHRTCATRCGGPVGVPVISCMEVATLVRRQRVELPATVEDWLSAVVSMRTWCFSRSRLKSRSRPVLSPTPIRDPADRLIVATAMHQGVPLVTKDARIRESAVVQTIW
ncbi:MAG TPA: PIN domain-containing protein [Thermoanaerobaculia bacterium]|nr:PIN domain-containing protein [Thermoanaerobaculia bacterium]